MSFGKLPLGKTAKGRRSNLYGETACSTTVLFTGTINHAANYVRDFPCVFGDSRGYILALTALVRYGELYSAKVFGGVSVELESGVALISGS